MSRAPIVLGAGALGLATALATMPLLAGGPPPAVVATVAIAAMVLEVAGVVGFWPDALAPAAVLLGAEYLASLALRGAGLNLGAPVYAAALFLCAELGWLARESAGGAPPRPARLLASAALALAAAGLGWAILALAAVPLAGGLALTALGVVAAVAAGLVLAWLATAARTA